MRPDKALLYWEVSCETVTSGSLAQLLQVASQLQVGLKSWHLAPNMNSKTISVKQTLRSCLGQHICRSPQLLIARLCKVHHCHNITYRKVTIQDIETAYTHKSFSYKCVQVMKETSWKLSLLAGRLHYLILHPLLILPDQVQLSVSWYSVV